MSSTTIRSHHRSQLVVAGDDPAGFLPLHEMERRYLLHVLASVGGNKSAAARIRGLDRRTMYRKLDRFSGEAPDAATGPRSAGGDEET